MLRPTDLPFIIKICGITNEEDARAAVEAGANALGFNFYEKSPRYVTVARAREIIDSVPGDYLKVGIFVDPAVDELNAAPADVVQLYGEWRPEFAGLTVWKATTPKETQRFCPAEAYVMDTPSPAFGGSGEMFDWTLARGRNRVIIAGGLDGSNVAAAIATAKPWGVDACSRLESRPGKKDERKVAEFVSTARQAFLTRLQQEVSL
ncbi:MAG: phosphoribosylanthranilate isomerase [Acidobacteriaceae bacterium]|nr:phosphoribosylanthranilate isomerase [Acidobacteriaceae bacterium]